MRSNTSCKNTVYNILYGTEPYTKSLEYGRNMEANARQKFEKITTKKVIECGLVIDPEIPFLAASQDRLIGKDALIEIKCPYSAQNTENAIDAINNKQLKYCKVVDNKYIQKKWINIEKIEYDNNFWMDKMEKQLKMFYLECLLPEIINSQFPKRMLKSDILEPDRILEKIKIKKK
ncbi:unnamed protein product [Macrosiphum euphorbiae]|uniref:YqaJ viral recombinase domain-containing protein n=1 Tax=Macrosiphum euphorbiae TaxID=13131 RepID=A0AAV0Y8J1_9HEMI|nr:unnamed protein product [Macrosiphum euphorbiae]